MTNLITVSHILKELEYGKILFSDVLVTRKRNLFMSRKWNTLDIKTGVSILSIHLLALFAPFTFTWGAFWTAMFIYALFGLFGITLSYHRNLAHHSFKLPKWLEYTFAYIGVLSLQRDPIFWVSMHRIHHQYVDSEKDPHSPIFGFWFSHMGWLFDSVTFLKSFGEGWHNNHHAFEYSARHGLEWWQIDVGWYIIRFLEAIGLATNVKLPTKDHELKKSFASHNEFN